MILAAILFFILGTLIGSFLNVVILRYNTGRGVIRGRSSCPHCGHELAWFELVPVISYIFLGGRCRKCRSKISWQYPAVELLTGITFTAVYLKSVFLIPDLIVASLLIVILVYDLKHKIIPDGLVYGFIIVSLLRCGILLHYSFFPILDLLAGPIMFLPFFLLWYLSSGRWMGFGDAKLAIGIGWFLGFFGALSAIILGFWIGAVVGIILLLWKRKEVTMKTEIPFAPFLILGLAVVYFFNIDVLGLSTLLFLR